MSSRERIPVLDVLTMIATILVVMGHHKFLREDIGWYPVYDKIIYSFHMGFFMSISGFLVKYTFSDNISWYTWVRKKAVKFIPAYFAVGLLASLLSSKSFDLFIHNVFMLIIDPVHGPIQIIWYIYVLLLFYCIAPFVFRLSSKCRLFLLALSLVVASYYNYFTPYFCLNHFFRMLPFFLLGALIADNYKEIKATKDTTIFLLGVPFLVFVIVCIILNENPMPQRDGAGRILTSILSLPLMYWISRKIVRKAKLQNSLLGFRLMCILYTFCKYFSSRVYGWYGRVLHWI